MRSVETVFYFCDGEVSDCRKTACYKRGGECRHTTDIFHALNPDGKRCFAPPNERGNCGEQDANHEVKTKILRWFRRF